MRCRHYLLTFFFLSFLLYLQDYSYRAPLFIMNRGALLSSYLILTIIIKFLIYHPDSAKFTRKVFNKLFKSSQLFKLAISVFQCRFSVNKLTVVIQMRKHPLFFQKINNLVVAINDVYRATTSSGIKNHIFNCH